MTKVLKRAVPSFLVLTLLFSILSSLNCNAQDPADMVYEKDVTVWFHNGVYWQDYTGEIFTQKSTGRKYIKIHHALNVQKGVVYKNSDYTGGIKGGKRTSCKYMTKCDNGNSYYFNM